MTILRQLEYRIREGKPDRLFLGRQRPCRADGIDLAHSLSFIMAVASSGTSVRASPTLLLLVSCFVSGDTSPLPLHLHTEFWRITPILSSVEAAFDSSSLLFSGLLKGQSLCLLYLFCNLQAFFLFICTHAIIGFKNQSICYVLYKATSLFCFPTRIFLSVCRKINKQTKNSARGSCIL